MPQTPGERIRYAIKQSGKKQNEIATAIGVTAQAVNKWIRDGQISRENLFRLSAETGFSYLWIAKGVGSMMSNTMEEGAATYAPSQQRGQNQSETPADASLDFDKTIMQKAIEAADYYEAKFNTKLASERKTDFISMIYSKYKEQKDKGQPLMDAKTIIGYMEIASAIKDPRPA